VNFSSIQDERVRSYIGDYQRGVPVRLPTFGWSFTALDLKQAYGEPDAGSMTMGVLHDRISDWIAAEIQGDIAQRIAAFIADPDTTLENL
jgi:hypothetical protein